MNFLQEILTTASQENKTLTQRALKLMEEAGELAEAVLSSTNAPGCGHKGKTNNDIIEETLDVIIVAGSVLQAIGVSNIEELNTAFSTKMEKWRKFGSWKDNSN